MVYSSFSVMFGVHHLLDHIEGLLVVVCVERVEVTRE